MIATKQQELETLAKIKKMVEELGEGSYIGTAFEGCFDLAEKNINEDAAYSMREHSAYLTRCEATKELEKKDEEIKSLKTQLEAEQEWKPYRGCFGNYPFSLQREGLYLDGGWRDTTADGIRRNQGLP